MDEQQQPGRDSAPLLLGRLAGRSQPCCHNRPRAEARASAVVAERASGRVPAIVKSARERSRLAGNPLLVMVDVRLREWVQQDADRVAVMLDDPHVAKWSHLPELGARRWIAEQRIGSRGPSRAVCTTEDDRALGKVALRLPEHASPATTCSAIRAEDQPAGELSYWVLPDARGRGIATAAARAALNLARELGAMRSVVLDIEIDNVPSLRIAERVGGQRRAPTRVERDRHGHPRTLAVYVVAL